MLIWILLIFVFYIIILFKIKWKYMISLSSHLLFPSKYAIMKPYDYLSDIESNWEKIKSEWDSFYDTNKNIPSFSKIYDSQKYLTDNDNKKWQAVVLKSYGIPITKNIELFPHTWSLIKNNPYITGAFFSYIEPHKKIPKHVGVYKGIYRYQLPLIIPEGDCFINVDGLKHNWVEGEGFLFDDTFEHYVENNTDKHRLLLIIDVMRDNLNGIQTNINKWLISKMPNVEEIQNSVDKCIIQ